MFLSICIPSYNRFEYLIELLNSIQEAKSNDFEVVVVDNCSNDDIFSIGKYDTRFKFVRREIPVPGNMNIFSIDYCSGRYVMLCLDKDMIDGKCLDIFLTQLKKIDGIPCGKCIINSTDTKSKFKIRKKFNYPVVHPSGMFYRKDVITLFKKSIGELDEKNPAYDNPFINGLIYMYGLQEKKEGVYLGKLISFRSTSSRLNQKSFIFSKEKKNFYFEPKNREKDMLLFFNQLDYLTYSKKEKKSIAANIFSCTLKYSTFLYQGALKDAFICSHYGIEMRKVTNLELLHNAKNVYSLYNKATTKYFSSILKQWYYFVWMIEWVANAIFPRKMLKKIYNILKREK